MNITPLLLFPLAFLPAAALAAQVSPPARMAELELARSRACVPALARLAAVNADLEPLAQRSERLRALASAVSLEDTTSVAPFDAADPLEVAVREWFAADHALALEYVASADTALQAQRRAGRERILARLGEALADVGASGQERIAAEEDLAMAGRCADAILVRPAVLEACGTTDSPVCEAARSAEPAGRYRFVEAPEDLWGVESLRPWSEPSRLGWGPGGGLAGARTATIVRRGNIVLSAGVQPMIRPRSSVSDEQATAMAAALDSMGFTFDHPGFVMAPALVVSLEVPGLLDGESHYLLHFGDLSNPAEQVVWSAAAQGGSMQAVIPVSRRMLDKLAAGEPLSLTAARLPEGQAGEAESIFTLGLTTVGQASAVASVMTYMAGGQLARDLAALAPPSTQPG